MKKQWTSPRILVQEFEANEYVAACWDVACNTVEANIHQGKTHFSGETHNPIHCGNAANQVLKDINNDGSFDTMTEVGTDNLGNLPCYVYTDLTYSTPQNLSNLKSGDLIFWITQTKDGSRKWFHQGWVKDQDPNHPNRS